MCSHQVSGEGVTYFDKIPIGSGDSLVNLKSSSYLMCLGVLVVSNDLAKILLISSENKYKYMSIDFGDSSFSVTFTDAITEVTGSQSFDSNSINLYAILDYDENIFVSGLTT